MAYQIISADTVWKAGSVHNLTSDVQIAAGATLTIQPGAIVNGNGYALQVFGTLNADGAAGRDIRFNNTVIENSGTYASPSYIKVNHAILNGGSFLAPSGGANYGHFTLTNSQLNGIPQIYVWYYGDSIIRGNLFQNCGAISVGIDSDKLIIDHNTFVGWTGTYNSSAAIENWASYGSAQILVTNNNFLDAGRTALELLPGYSSTGMTASGNYFGTLDPSIIAQMVYDQTVDLRCAGTIPNNSIQNGPVAGSPLPSYTYQIKAGQTITGAIGNNTFIAKAAALVPSDSVDGGPGRNTLVLSGAGIFDLRAPAKLVNIETVRAQEGKDPYSSGGTTIPGTRQTVYLRDGLNVTLNAASAGTDASGNPNKPGITIYGANGANVINLGTGDDEVYLGSAAETVHGGGGNNTFHVTASTIGATIDGGSGKSQIFLTGGGTAAMGGNITNIADVWLARPGAGQPNNNFTANSIANLHIHGSVGNDTITVGAPTQTVLGVRGDDRFIASTNNAGAHILGGSGNTTLEITDSGTATLWAQTSVTNVVMDQAGKLVLSTKPMTAIGSPGDDGITARGAGQILTGGAGKDMLVGAAAGGDTFRDTAAGLKGDTIAKFIAGDTIDITDMVFSGTTALSYLPAKSGASGVLTVSDGAHLTRITLLGGFSATDFHMSSDGSGGTAIAHA